MSPAAEISGAAGPDDDGLLPAVVEPLAEEARGEARGIADGGEEPGGEEHLQHDDGDGEPVAVDAVPGHGEEDGATHRGDAEPHRLLEPGEEEGPAVHLHEPEDEDAARDENREGRADVRQPLRGRHPLETDDGSQHVSQRGRGRVEHHQRGEPCRRSSGHPLHFLDVPPRPEPGVYPNTGLPSHNPTPITRWTAGRAEYDSCFDSAGG